VKNMNTTKNVILNAILLVMIATVAAPVMGASAPAIENAQFGDEHTVITHAPVLRWSSLRTSIKIESDDSGRPIVRGDTRVARPIRRWILDRMAQPEQVEAKPFEPSALLIRILVLAGLSAIVGAVSAGLAVGLIGLIGGVSEWHPHNILGANGEEHATPWPLEFTEQVMRVSHFAFVRPDGTVVKNKNGNYYGVRDLLRDANDNPSSSEPLYLVADPEYYRSKDHLRAMGGSAANSTLREMEAKQQARESAFKMG
jgi:hypothetical protein